MKDCVNYVVELIVYDIEEEHHFLLCSHSYKISKNKYIPSTVCAKEFLLI